MGKAKARKGVGNPVGDTKQVLECQRGGVINAEQDRLSSSGVALTRTHDALGLIPGTL